MPLLTPAQFKKTSAARKPGASYDRYVKYATNMPKKRAAKRARQTQLNPASAFTEQWQQLAGMFGGLDPSFRPLGEEQIRARAAGDVSSIIDPLIARTTEKLTAQAKAGRDAISGAYGDLAESVRAVPGQWRQDFGQAEADLAGTTGALGDFLSGRGTSAFNELSGKLGEAGLHEGAVQDAAGGAQGLAQGAAGEAAGRGFSMLQRTIGDRAANLGYAHKLPALASLSASALGREHEAGQRSLLEGALADITAQIPGLTSGIVRDYRGDELDKADARSGRQADLAKFGASFLEGYLNRSSSERIAKSGLELDYDQLAQDQQQFQQGLDFDYDQLEQQSAADTTGKEEDQAKARQDAITNRSNALEDARTGTVQLATGLKVATRGPKRPELPKSTYGTAANPYVDKERPATYQEAFKRAWALYAPSLKARYALKDAEIKKIIDEGLVAAGYSPPAATPRPSRPGGR